jgi:hypothetical protein
MTHRAKPAAAFVDEVTELVARHQVLDITMIDSILPSEYYTSALPEFAVRNYDWKMHYEIKANIKPDDVAALRSARVWGVQPGIESLVDDVLQRMDKGVRSVHNVRMIRDGCSAGLGVTWNWLYGFPGERLADYQAVMAQLPALVHLQPPDGLSRINLQRFSPNFDRPDLGFTERWPAEASHYVYDLPADRLTDLVYSFDTHDQGLTTGEAEPLNAALNQWKANYPTSFLSVRHINGALVVRDRRVGWPAVDHLIDDEREIAAWTDLTHGRSVRALLRNLTAAGIVWTDEDLLTWLHHLRRNGLVFTDADRWITLPTSPEAAVPAPKRAPRAVIPLRIEAISA